MIKKTFSLVLLVLMICGSYFIYTNFFLEREISGAPPYGESEEESQGHDPYAFLKNWSRPQEKAKVAIQVGHYKNQEVPEELHRLKDNTGASAGGVDEVEINLAIAEKLAEKVRFQNVDVEILPTTVPPKYWADVFIAIHADGSTDTSKSGFKFAGPWRDFTGKSDKLVDILTRNYQEDSGLDIDPNVTRNMRGYYAFSWWRYDHAIHPMTTAVIAETGFLTNRSDRSFLVNKQDLIAESLSRSIVDYLKSENLL